MEKRILKYFRNGYVYNVELVTEEEGLRKLRELVSVMGAKWDRNFMRDAVHCGNVTVELEPNPIHGWASQAAMDARYAGVECIEV